MQTPIALTGQWEGLRAFPRIHRTPDHRRRLEGGLDRLQGLYEEMAARAALLARGMERLNSLRASMVDQLDALDSDADLEPSLGFPEASDRPWWAGMDEDDHGNGSDLEGEHDGAEPDVDDEPTLGRSEAIDQSRIEMGSAHEDEWSLGWGADVDQRGVGVPRDKAIWFAEQDTEEQCEDEGHDSDREPEPSEACNWPDEGSQLRAFQISGVWEVRP